MADWTIPHPALERMELRKQMMEAVNRLLEAVDLLIAELDGDATDPDLEPTMGALQGLDQRRWAEGAADDREDAPGDDEHSLGWTEGESRSGRLGHPTADAEPSLGSNDQAVDQRRWSSHPIPGLRDRDLEAQCEDEGGACEDEGGQCEGEGDDPYHIAPADDAVLQAITGYRFRAY